MAEKFVAKEKIFEYEKHFCGEKEENLTNF